MAAAYRDEFAVNISASALKNHARFKLEIKKPRSANYRHVTTEQVEWLKDIYPKTGVKNAAKLWNDKFNDSLTATCIKQIAKRIGNVTVNPEIATANKLRAAHGPNSKRAIRKAGETRMECGRLVMKSEDGEWKSAGRCVWEMEHGKIPKGYALIALDGDTSNIRLDNLEIVPWRYLGLLSMNNFFSNDPEITKTGVVWCDLKTVLEERAKEMPMEGEYEYD